MSYWGNGVSTLYHADAREIPLPDGSVHCAVTSPPYFGLRDYGLGEWQGGDADCGHERNRVDYFERWPNSKLNGVPTNIGGDKQGWPNNTCGHCGAVNTPAGIGLEPTLAEHIANIVAVFRELRRVLRDDGTAWLNYGDAYSSGSGGLKDWAGSSNPVKGIQSRPPYDGLPPKNLMGLPWRVAFALQDDGWILRSAIVWHKPNPMPESVTDRPTSAYENVFLLAKQPKYYYDAEAIRETNTAWTIERAKYPKAGHKRRDGSADDSGIAAHSQRENGTGNLSGANARNVWTIPTQGRSDAHFATFPDELPRRCILAGTSARGVCEQCGAPQERAVHEGELRDDPQRMNRKVRNVGNLPMGGTEYSKDGGTLGKVRDRDTLGWRPTCDHDAGTVPATVLDCFVGSGTTVAVAQTLGRRGVGVDLNTEYLDIAVKRIGAISLPMALGV